MVLICRFSAAACQMVFMMRCFRQC